MLCTLALIWMWFCGAYMVWEKVRAGGAAPDPAGYGYSPDLLQFYNEHPELHTVAYVLCQLLTIIPWPIVMTIGIIRQVHLKIRPLNN